MGSERLDKYELLHHLASGGMASVYLARLSGLGGFARHVVLKTLESRDQQLVAMFLDEARVAATLHHQHIAQVFDLGCVDGKYFLAMEYLHGETARAVLATAHTRGVRLPLEFGLALGSAAASGLHYAHEQRSPEGKPLEIVHRDVSPSNVIVTYDGTVKLIDFGIAKAAGRTTKTATGFVKGKSGYMAPEQILGYEVDRRTDVFALGVLLYELTTQRRAFGGDSEHEATHRIVHGTIVPPSHLVPGYPVELEDVVMTALELDPDDRFQDAAAMQHALEQIARELDLILGAGPLMRVLDDLFGSRREPWIGSLPTPGKALARGTATYDTFEGETSSAKATHRIIKVKQEEPEAETIPIVLPAMPAVAEPQPPRPPPQGPTVLGLPRRTAIVVVSAALACGVGLGLLWLGARSSTVAQPAAPLPVVPAPPPRVITTPVKRPAPVPAPAPAIDRVKLHVTSVPTGATVVLDGVRLGTTPYDAPVALKHGQGWLKVRKRHYKAIRIQVPLDHDVEWAPTLPPLTSDPP